VIFDCPYPWQARWRVCDRCGGCLTKSGKFLPRDSGRDIPRLPVTVILWQNDMVMCFDKDGQQVEWAQGHVARVRPLIEPIVPFSRWHRGDWPGGVIVPELPR
jgi:hypothetical protein